MNTGAIGDIVIDRLRERVRLLEHHADLCTQLHRVNAFVVDVFAVQEDVAFDTANIDGVVHPVQRTQERGFTATRRADERSHGFIRDINIHVFDGMRGSVVDLHVAGRKFDVLHVHRSIY